MDRQPYEPSGEALDNTIAELYKTAQRLQALRAVMGHIAFRDYRPQDRSILADAAETLKELGETIDGHAETPEATQHKGMFKALLGTEHWDEVFSTRSDDAYEIAIVSDRTVRVDGREKPLAPEYIFVLNQLLMDRRPFTTTRLRQLMQQPDGEEVTLQQLRAIASGLHLILGEKAMVYGFVGARVEFYLRQELVVVDERPEVTPLATGPAIVDEPFEMPPGVMGVDGDFYARPLPAIADPLDTLSNKIGGVTLWFKLGDDPEQVGEEGYDWSEIETISRLAGVSDGTAARFVRRHAARFDDEFMPPELRKPRQNVPTGTLTEHFSPQFVEWAVASLRAARALYVARAQQQATPQSQYPRRDAS